MKARVPVFICFLVILLCVSQIRRNTAEYRQANEGKVEIVLRGIQPLYQK